MPFIRRYPYFPGVEEITQIEGIIIVDQPQPSGVQGVGSGTVAIIGECIDCTSAVKVDASGHVSTRTTPIEVFGPTDALAKVGGYDATIGDVGNAGGSGFIAATGKMWSRLIMVPINLASTRGMRAWRKLPTNRTSTDASPVVPMSGSSVPAGTEFRSGTSRVRTAGPVTFAGRDAYTKGTDGAVTAVPGAATAGTITGSAGPFLIRPTQPTKFKIDGGGAQVWTWGAVAAVCKMVAAGAYAGSHAGTFTIEWTDKDGAGQTATITIDGTAIGEGPLFAQINDALAAAGVPAVIEDSNDTGKPQFKLRVFGASTAIAITAITGGAAFTTDTGIAAQAQTTAPTVTLTKTGGTGAKTVAVAFCDVATATEVDAAIALADDVTGGSLTHTNGTTGTLTLTSGTTGGGSKVQVDPTSQALLGFDTAEHTGAAAGAGGGTQLQFNAAGGDFVNAGVKVGDACVLGVIDGAGALGANADTYRVAGINSGTQLLLEQQDGSSFNWTTGATLPWRLHVGECADSGPLAASAAPAGYLVPARPLDATIAGSTLLSPTIAPDAATATTWDVLSGLEAQAHPDGITYTASVQAPNATNHANLDVLYQSGFDALMGDGLPQRDVNIVVSARHSTNIRAAGKAHALLASRNGIGRMFMSAPQLSVQDVNTVIGDGDPGAGANRHERVAYSWPGAQQLIKEAVNTSVACADGSTTTEGMLDVAMDAFLASDLSILPPERNPGELTDTTLAALINVRGVQRGVGTLGMTEYTALRRGGVAALRMSRTDTGVRPEIVSGITTSLRDGERNINRRRMTDFIEDSSAALLLQYTKQPVTQALRDAATHALDDFGRELRGDENPAQSRITDYLVTDKAKTTQSLLRKGIFVISMQVQTTPTADFIVAQFEVGENVVINGR